MSNHPDERQNIITDLQSWIKQNQATGLGWYLDEGDQPDVIPVMAEAATSAPVAAPEAPVAAPVKSVAAKPVAAKPVSAPATSAPATSATKTPPATPVSDKEAAFQTLCDQFIAETMALIQQQAPNGFTSPTSEPLLEKHGGDAVAAMAALRAEVVPCTACELGTTRTNTVFGAGNPEADVVFIGEAPGQDEDQQGEPFVGPSGQLLTKILGAIGFAREDVFICNILKCRPPNNRDPQPHEVQHCEPHLKRQLAILRPRVICCLGRVAAQTLLKTDLSLGKLRQKVHFYEGVPVMATFHPAALLRNPGWKRDTWEDVRKLRALNEALSERGA